MKENKTINNILKIIFMTLFFAFLTLYISNQTGYYQHFERKKMVLTEEKIKLFEQDIKNGISLDLESYLENSKVNYNNKASSIGLFLSNKIGEYAKSSLEATFKMLSNLIED